MSNPINIGITPKLPELPSAPTEGPQKTGTTDFVNAMRDQLTHVADIQKEADDQTRKLVAGETDNMSEVFVAARKAQAAFSMLMEMRNKLVDAYEEIRNLRV